jgi:hypothetical protein
LIFRANKQSGHPTLNPVGIVLENPLEVLPSIQGRFCP